MNNVLKISFDEWNQQVKESFLKLLGDEYQNQENIDFLMNDVSYREHAYNRSEEPRFYALEIWHDHGLNFEQGKGTFLIENGRNYNAQ